MDKFIKPSRIIALALAMAILLSVYALTLYRIQALDSQALLDDAPELTATNSTVYAARGSMLDRNGVLLASDRTVYDVKIDRNQLLKAEEPNSIILTLIGVCAKYGVKYNDPFPVTTAAPFEYYVDATNTQKSWLRSYFKYFTNSLGIEDTEDPQVPATDLISWMRDHYKIPYTATAEDARKIIGVRYGLEMQVINYSDYVFAADVSDKLVSYLSEQNLPCVAIVTRSEREYHTPYASHLIGYIGAMSTDEYNNKYKALGYPFNARIGKVGAEAAFEEYLHGTDGEITTYRDPSGAVTDVEVKKEAQAGSNVYLTIDIQLQQVAENALASTIAQMNMDREAEAREKAEKEGTVYEEPDYATGGAAVMLDVKTGEVLALASYPTFDLNTFYDQYTALNNDPLKPLVNRATQGTYNPGSTFKMVTAYAALSNHTISTRTTIHDDSKFTKYPDYQPRCWISPGSHGTINVVQALEKSCNYFFYTVADNMGITKIADTAKLFGFGDHTGIEIGDSTGTVASIESKRELQDEGWWDADTLIACIGQGLNLFTPIQIANYVATIANGGTRYFTTVLRNITSYDYSDVIMRRAPQVAGVIDDPEGYIPVLQQGMKAVAKTGTAANALSNYPIPVAAKTGTVQSDTSKINDGVFVCYAPANDPQIAISVVVQKGGSGAALITIAKDLMDAYFADTASTDVSAPTDNSLLK